jgi:dihydroneopterin aldolase
MTRGTSSRDLIEIEGLAIRAHHGVFEHERRDGQLFILDLRLALDLTPAGRSDALRDTVHYGEVIACVRRIFTHEPFNLIEAAAHHVARGILADFPLIESVRIRLRKPDAPIDEEFEHVACIIERSRGDV